VILLLSQNEGKIFGIVNTEAVDLFLIYLDNNHTFRDEISNKYMKPILEEWSGVELVLTSVILRLEIILRII